MADLSLSAKELAEIIEDHLGDDPNGSTPDAGVALAYLNNGYREGLAGRHPRSNKAHVWSFLRDTDYVLTLSQYDTGTVSGSPSYDGSAYSTVTATASVFFPSQVGGSFVFDTSETSYTVYDYDSATQIKLEGDASGETSGDTFYTESGGVYDLASDFGGLIGEPVFVNKDDEGLPRLKQADLAWLRRRYKEDYDQEEPEYWAIINKPYTASTGERFQFMVWPPPDDDYDVLVPYRRLPDRLTDSASVYPVGGPELALLWQYLGLKHMEIARGQFDGPWANLAAQEMIACIDRDRRWLSSGNKRSSLVVDTGMGLR